MCTPDDFADLRVASVDAIADLYFRDNDDVLRRKFRGAVDAAKQKKIEGEMLRRSRVPPARVLETIAPVRC